MKNSNSNWYKRTRPPRSSSSLIIACHHAQGLNTRCLWRISGSTQAEESINTQRHKPFTSHASIRKQSFLTILIAHTHNRMGQKGKTTISSPTAQWAIRGQLHFVSLLCLDCNLVPLFWTKIVKFKTQGPKTLLSQSSSYPQNPPYSWASSRA